MEEKERSAWGDGQEQVSLLGEGEAKQLEVSAPCPILPCLGVSLGL